MARLIMNRSCFVVTLGRPVALYLADKILIVLGPFPKIEKPLLFPIPSPIIQWLYPGLSLIIYALIIPNNLKRS